MILFRSVVTKLLIFPTRLISFLGLLVGGAVRLTVDEVADEADGATVLDFPLPAVEVVAVDSESVPETAEP